MAVLGTEFQQDWGILLLVDTNEPTEMKMRLRERFKEFFPIDSADWKWAIMSGSLGRRRIYTHNLRSGITCPLSFRYSMMGTRIRARTA